jgi:cell fate regulator YaaT (PSP1 superfamily)
MADTPGAPVAAPPTAPFQPPTSLDEARALARERFKSRLLAGEKVGECACHDEAAPHAAAPASAEEPAARVAGVRFRDSGRTYFFDPAGTELEVGDWVVVETSRGREAGRVVIAPHQVRLNLLQGELKPVLRRLDAEDVRRMDELKREAAQAIKTFGAAARARNLPVKPISAEYAFDGASLVLNFSFVERERPDLRDLTRELAGTFGCRVELRQVGPRDEARLLGGLGRCGRTLCCSSWLPVFPEISMNMAKTQDLPLNPSKVSGVCGRLLCCLSYENEQYKQMKAVLPRLGQPIETPAGPGMVISLQVLKELVTVRLAADNAVAVFPAADLGLGNRPAAPVPPDRGVAALDHGAEPATVDAPPAANGADPANGPDAAGGERRRRRRRGRGRRPGGDPQPTTGDGFDA